MSTSRICTYSSRAFSFLLDQTGTVFLLILEFVFLFFIFFFSLFFFALSCLDSIQASSSCCNCDQKVGSHSGTGINCQSNGKNTDITQSCDAEGSSYHDKVFATYRQPSYATGWMYVNQNGQMCGPYIQEQLYEGLATGFLPEELHVYPILNGALINPVPLKYFRQFPDHVATGFTYLAAAAASCGSKGQLDSSMGSTLELVANRQEFCTKSTYSNCKLQSCMKYCGSGNGEVSSSENVDMTMMPSIPLVYFCLKCVV
jgi:hypothetical protein